MNLLLSPSPFGWWVVRRALGWFLVLSAGALVVAAGTDEPDSSWAMRVARWTAVAPVLLGVACAATLRHAERRGELRALRAIGVSQADLGCMLTLAAGIVGIALTAALSTPLTDVSALFPTVELAEPWRPRGAGFENLSLGVRVGANMDVSFIPSEDAIGSVTPASRWAAWLLAAPATLVMPLWVAVPVPPWERGLMMAGAIVGSLVLFHVLAVGSLSAGWMALPALALGVQAVHAGWRVSR